MNARTDVSKESTARFGAMACLVERLPPKQVCHLQLLVRNSSEYTGRRTQIQCVTSALRGGGLPGIAFAVAGYTIGLKLFSGSSVSQMRGGRAGARHRGRGRLR